MLDFIKDHPEGGIDKSQSSALQNCTTACTNVLRAGGVSGKDERPGAGLSTLFFDSPKALAESLTSGALKDHVAAVIDLPAKGQPQQEDAHDSNLCDGKPCPK